MKSLNVGHRLGAIAFFLGGCLGLSSGWAAQQVEGVENAHRLTGIHFSGGALSSQLIFEYNGEGKLIKVSKFDDNAPAVMNDEVQFSYGTNQVHMSTSFFEKIYGEPGVQAKTHERALHGTFILNNAARAYTYVGKINDSEVPEAVATQYSMNYGAGNALTKVVDAKDAKHRAQTYVWKGNTCASIKDAQQTLLKLTYGDEPNDGNLALNALLIGGLKMMEGIGVPVDYLHAMGYLGKKSDKLLQKVQVDTQAVAFGQQKYDPNPEYTFSYQRDDAGRLMQIDVVQVDHQKKVEEGQQVTISNEEVTTEYTIFMIYE